MNYYYDPILGLQYTTVEEYIFMIDIKELPENCSDYDSNEIFKIIAQKGIPFLNPELEKTTTLYL